MSARRPYVLVFVAFLAIYLLTAPGYMWNTDGWTRYLVAVGLVEYGRPILPPTRLPGPHWVTRGPDGSPYSYFGVGQSLAFLPLYLAGEALRALAGPSPDWPAVLASFLNTAVAALLAVAVFALARGIGHGPWVGLGTAALSGLGTIVWAHSRDNYDHLIETLCLTSTLAVLVTALDRASRRGYILAGVLFGAGLVTRLSIVFALPGLGVLLARGSGPARSTGSRLLAGALFAAGSLPAIAFVALYNWSRFGGPLVTGYGGTKGPFPLGMPVGQGVATLLVSPGRGLVWYVPLVLAVPFLARRLQRRRPGLALGLLVIGLGYLLGYSQFAGLGLWGWGPYYLLPLMPLVAIVWAEALPRWSQLSPAARLALGTLAALGVLIGALSTAAAYRRTYVEATVAHVSFDQGIDWRPEWSLLLRQPGHVLRALRAAHRSEPLRAVGESATHDDRLAHDIGLNTLDWWWVRARYRGARWTWLVPLGLGAVAIASVWGFHRATRPRVKPPS